MTDRTKREAAPASWLDSQLFPFFKETQTFRFIISHSTKEMLVLLDDITILLSYVFYK